MGTFLFYAALGLLAWLALGTLVAVVVGRMARASTYYPDATGDGDDADVS